MTEKEERRENDVRIAVVESRLDGHSLMLENNQELTARLVDRLDLHIQDGIKRDDSIRTELAGVSLALSCNNLAVNNLTSVVTEATNAIKEVSDITRGNQLELTKIDAVWHTLAKVAAIVVLAVSGLWAVVTYVIDKNDTPKVMVK